MTIPLPLLSLDKDSVKLHNLLCSRKPSLQWHDSSGSNFQLQIKKNNEATLADIIQICMIIGDETLYINAQFTQLQKWLYSSIGNSPVQALPEPLLLLAIEKKISPWQAILKEHIGYELTPVKINKKIISGKYRVPAILESEDSEVAIQVELDSTNLIEKIPHHRNRSLDFNLMKSIYVGYTDLDISELKNIRLGDVIFFDKCYLSEKKGIVKINNMACWIAKIEDNSVSLLHPANPNNYQDFFMSEDYNDDTPTKEVAMEQIPVRLSFEVGQQDINLSELDSLQPGYVFEMNRSEEEPVILKANGQAIGHCELVKVNDKLGVRIIHLYKAGEI